MTEPLRNHSDDGGATAGYAVPSTAVAPGLRCDGGINEWNKLPADCEHSSSVNTFKNRIDNYFVRAVYT